MKIYWTKIKTIIDETSDIKTYLLEVPEGYTWEEGAHLHLAMQGFNVADKPNKNLVRHMSISTLPSEKTVGITTRIRENCSEFKAILRSLNVGDEVAIFKTRSNVPLKRENKNIYLLSSGVGLATYRPLVLDYFKRPDNVKKVHSLNIDSSGEFLFTDIFQKNAELNFTPQFVANRDDYYDEVKKIAHDSDGLYYIVGSDEFLAQNISVLLASGIQAEQIILDKHPHQRAAFLPETSEV